MDKVNRSIKAKQDDDKAKEEEAQAQAAQQQARQSQQSVPSTGGQTTRRSGGSTYGGTTGRTYGGTTGRTTTPAPSAPSTPSTPTPQPAPSTPSKPSGTDARPSAENERIGDGRASFDGCSLIRVSLFPSHCRPLNRRVGDIYAAKRSRLVSWLRLAVFRF